VKLAPLPAPGADDGSWRAAYSASPELLGGEFELVADGAEPVGLPAPVEHGAAESQAVAEPEDVPTQEPAHVPPPPPQRLFGRRRQSAPEPAPSDELHQALAAEREARQLAAEERARAQRAEALLGEELRKTVGKTEELIDRIDGYEHGRVSFEQELAAVRRTHADLLAEAREEHAREVSGLREELDVARRELAAALDDVDALNDHVDTLHDAHVLELGAARQQRDAAEQRHSALEQQLAEARAAAETLRAQLDEREELMERARAEVAQGVEETADLHAAVGRLRDAITARAREVVAAQGRFARTPEALDRSREELRRDAERIAALERQAEALRDAIHSQLPYSLHASPLQEALPLPEEEVQSEA
jgi:chromosome segregation ATPase